MGTQTAIYCRTAIPDSEEIARQRAVLEGCAKEQGYEAIVVYADDGFSGRDQSRPAFTRLEEDIRAGKIARVLAVSITRLGRNTMEVLRWVRDNAVEIYTLDMRREPS